MDLHLLSLRFKFESNFLHKVKMPGKNYLVYYVLSDMGHIKTVVHTLKDLIV